ncbi:hypothetical protein BX616_004107 [Lobosporangium transversale]|uniref:Uncharacterized protein n=1 Tax=Lobosporangium transversale TaxID=64571 RepID=A0A1Y2G922_9FUNG|nr:hypothetical protein BCR41DRAFT_341939 [Lobosporangium transversale]KAF9916295.1 hypothetical protein BX616_004107 [Lobosporangium transversale]ORZ04564.1 hypothetical protein BCR41DRAFT_341939 [Lobosporangium transversale]|eukprot:XP_021876610.1 hypothetical protein BCR41DRAFT_341939 [Lobosporangium transversale]
MSLTYFSPVTRVLLPTIFANFSIQIVGWGISAALQTEKIYDLTGSTSFLLCTFLSLAKPFAKNVVQIFHPRQILASGTTVIWASYLGLFLFNRALAHDDKRFERVKKTPSIFLTYWLIQSIWVGMTALPVYLTNSISSEFHPQLGVKDYVGLSIWAFGFTFEVIANYQKQQWRKNIGKDYKHSFISSGLWSLSRHPNYFGECMLWFGSHLLCSSAFSIAVHKQIMSLWISRLAMISPIFVTFLITRVSGIPLLERENDRRLKDVVAYWKYKKETSMFVPTWRRSTAL